MKLRKFGQVLLAAAVGIGSSLGITSCVQIHTVGYFYVTGSQYNQIGVYKIYNNTGNLAQVGTPISSGGVNPVDAITAKSGRFLYVLNAGCADPTAYPNANYQCASGQTPTASNIQLFTIGGDGTLTPELSYTSQGLNSVAISLDSTGNYMYILDQNVPTTNIPSQYAADGDVTIYAIDPNTGRLSIQQNLQQEGNNGYPLYIFPTGVAPVWFKTYSSYLYIIDRNDGALPNPTYLTVYSTTTGGQLQVTQNAEIPTGATNLVYATTGSTYFFLLDAGDPTNSSSPNYNGTIYTYQTGTNGNLTPVLGGTVTQASEGYTIGVNPDVMVASSNVSSSGTYLWVASYGPNTSSSGADAASNVSSYDVSAAGQITPVAGVEGGGINSGSGSGPRCILEDPSNQYLFTADFASNTIVEYVINTENGLLVAPRGTATTTAPGNPTWCVASGNVF